MVVDSPSNHENLGYKRRKDDEDRLDDGGMGTTEEF